MILKIAANTGQVAYDWNTVTAKLLGIADPGKHEQARRLDHSRAQNSFLFSHDRMTLCAVQQPNPGAAISRKRKSSTRAPVSSVRFSFSSAGRR